MREVRIAVRCERAAARATITRRQRDKRIFRYEVLARSDGNDVALLKVEDEEMARFIEGWLEDKLRIKDDGVDLLVESESEQLY